MSAIHADQKPAILPQFLAGISASLSSLATGTAYGWSSPVGLKLTSNDTSSTPVGQTFGAESDEIAWITSFLIIGILVTSFGASYLADKIGRKWTLMCSAGFFLISYILFIFAYDVGIIYVGRIVQGFGAGVMLTTLPLYIGEIATDEIRGAMGSFLAIFLTAGILYAYVWGVHVSYSLLQIVCLAIPIIFLIIFFFMPESPYYLVANGRVESALAALKFLRRQRIEVLEEEIERLQAMVDESAAIKSSILDIFKNSGSFKAFFICFGLISLQQLTGAQSVLFNAQIIFERAHVNIGSGLASIILVAFQLASVCTASFLVDRMGRKVLLLTSHSVMAAALVVLGLFFYLNQSGVDTSSISWLPLVTLIVFIASGSVGILPVTFVIVGEVFAPNIKFNASALLTICGAVLGFATTRCYSPMLLVGYYFPFWIYAFFCILGFIFVWFVVVETKGRSFEEIQEVLNKK